MKTYRARIFFWGTDPRRRDRWQRAFVLAAGLANESEWHGFPARTLRLRQVSGRIVCFLRFPLGWRLEFAFQEKADGWSPEDLAPTWRGMEQPGSEPYRDFNAIEPRLNRARLVLKETE